MFGKKKKPGTIKPEDYVTFIENAGGCICTWSVINGETPLRWCFREESVNPVDNGWRFLGASDTDEYINNVENCAVFDFNTIANIEPAVLAIYDMPIGTDICIEKGPDNKIRFLDTNTGEEVDV